MIQYCPYCGHRIAKPITCGITSCSNCRRLFDSNLYHRLLSAFWLAHKVPGLDRDRLTQQHFFSEADADLVLNFVVENGYTYQEFDKLLISNGIKDQRYVA